ncbi:MAG: energy transducer TonB, partial [Alistipes sp.]|nr:energy transducer TonB [Alistipes sp.]
MKTLLFEAAKILICSAVLWGAYEALLNRRIQPRACRFYLSALPLLAVLIPWLRIPLLPAPVLEIEPFVFAETVGAEPAPVAAASFPFAEAAIGALWLTGTAVILGAIARQLRTIRRLRRRATLDRGDRFTIALTEEPIAPFSFFRTIYLWKGTPADERQTVLLHEASHIARRHSGERLLMECMKALLWWNPFVWLAARRLTEAEEYEADRDVLTSGYDRQLYMTAIFRQLFGYSPDIAAGLQNSLTKKRFQMMTTHISGRYALLRLAGTALAITGLLCTFSLSTRAAVIRTTPGAADTAAVSDTPEPLYIVNGEEQGSKEEAYALGKALASAKKGTSARLRNLTPEEAMQKYGEKGRNGAVEISVPADIEATEATSVPEVVAVRFGTEKSSHAAASAPPAPDAANDPDEPWLIAETMPTFQGGGLQDFRTWIQQRLRYPETAASGRVVATFIVERDGSIGSVRVLQSPDDALSDEAVRVLRSVPAGAWTPGLQGGEPVRVRYTLPIDFRTIAAETTAAEHH